jgi:hypothetical protein
MHINKDAVVYSQTTWTNSEISQILVLMGLPVSSSLSVISVEMMPRPETYINMASGVVDNNNALYASAAFGAPAKKAANKERATAGATAVVVNDNNSPLGNALGQFRILRTSPLTAVPFVCCT